MATKKAKNLHIVYTQIFRMLYVNQKDKPLCSNYSFPPPNA